MKISTRGRYALRIMLDIAIQCDGKPVSFKEVSERQNISFKYMEQIGSSLTRAGFLKSVRGANGGYYLTGEPADFTVGMILRVTEGDLVLVPCIDCGSDRCMHETYCLTRPMWEELNARILELVDNITLQDLIDGYGSNRIAIDIR